MASPRTRRLRKRIGLTALAAVILAVTAFLVWCSILYPATPEAFELVTDDSAIALTETPDALVLTPTAEANGAGLVFIPGAKVPAEAYAYKLSGLVKSGTTVVITKPILNLAFFDYRPFETFTSLAPDVAEWSVGGHSLGGVKACQFVEGADAAGLVLFGSYCANDLSSSSIPTLSIGASDDGLSTPSDISERAGALPAGAELVQIEGANHAAFGDYGVQPGDGRATLTSAEVESQLTELLTSFAPLEG